jgi:hypothetical protein
MTAAIALLDSHGQRSRNALYPTFVIFALATAIVIRNAIHGNVFLTGWIAPVKLNRQAVRDAMNCTINIVLGISQTVREICFFCYFFQ